VRHGLTTSPDWSKVTFWYRIILDDPIIEPDLLDLDPKRQAALHLAEAEAWRDRAIRAEEAHLADMASRALTRGQWMPPKDGALDLEDPETLQLMIKNYTDDFMRGALEIMLRASPKRPVAQRNTQKQLVRRRADADPIEHVSGEPGLRQITSRDCLHGISPAVRRSHPTSSQIRGALCRHFWSGYRDHPTLCRERG
jgi:hypothetical protein